MLRPLCFALLVYQSPIPLSTIFFNCCIFSVPLVRISPVRIGDAGGLPARIRGRIAAYPKGGVLFMSNNNQNQNQNQEQNRQNQQNQEQKRNQKENRK